MNLDFTFYVGVHYFMGASLVVFNLLKKAFEGEQYDILCMFLFNDTEYKHTFNPNHVLIVYISILDDGISERKDHVN